MHRLWRAASGAAFLRAPKLPALPALREPALDRAPDAGAAAGHLLPDHLHAARRTARPGLEPSANGLWPVDAVCLGHLGPVQPQPSPTQGPGRRRGRAAHPLPAIGVSPPCASGHAGRGLRCRERSVAQPAQDQAGWRLPVQPQGPGSGVSRQVAGGAERCGPDRATVPARALGGRLQERGQWPQGAGVSGPLPVPRRDPGA